MTIKQTPQTFAFLIAGMERGTPIKYKLTKKQSDSISEQIAEYFFGFFINSLNEDSPEHCYLNKTNEIEISKRSLSKKICPNPSLN